jgi:hypothetical protein
MRANEQTKLRRHFMAGKTRYDRSLLADGGVTRRRLSSAGPTGPQATMPSGGPKISCATSGWVSHFREWEPVTEAQEAVL